MYSFQKQLTRIRNNIISRIVLKFIIVKVFIYGIENLELIIYGIYKIVWMSMYTIIWFFFCTPVGT